MLKKVKKMAPEDFVFVLDKCSDGEKACGFTWHIELKTRPEAGAFLTHSQTLSSIAHLKMHRSPFQSRNFMPAAECRSDAWTTGKFANGGSFYELNDEGKIVYVR